MLTVCENPFNLQKDQRSIALLPAETVGEALEREGLDGRYVLSCNGELLPPERGLSYVPQDGDDVQAVSLLENSTLRSIALIGVTLLAAAVTYGASLTLFGTTIGFTGLGLGQTASAVAFSAISIGGTLAVNAIASLFQQKPGGSNYGVLGPITTARSGIPIPKGYGTIRSASNIVESWVDIMGNNQDQHDVDDGADTIGRQYINVRCNFGFGPARSISDLRINDQDISNYADVAYCILYGVNDETPVTASDPRWVIVNRTNYGTTQNDYPTTDFNTINNNYPKGQRARAAGPGVVLPGQRSDTQKLAVYVVFPQGVWRLDENEVIKRAAISYDVYYRLAGSGDSGWIKVNPNWSTPNGETHYYYNIRQTVLRQATIIDGLTPGKYDVKVVKNGAGAVLDGNPLDYFEHESNQWGDQLWVESVQETSYDTLAYPNMIQVCVRIMASDQLAGADLNLTAVIEYGLRSDLPDELAGLSEDTPAAVAYDVLHDPVIGADIADERIDLNFFTQWAALTQTMMDDGDGGTQKLAVFNGVFDQSGQSIWDVLQTIGVMSRASLQRVGTKITGWLDVDDDPVQMFHVGNMLADSYSKTYLNLEDRAQEIAVTFADEDDDYRTRNPLRVIADVDENSSEALKKTDITLLGCTSRVQAWYWARLRLLEMETLLRSHTWKSNTMALRVRTGNIVKLQHDVPQWGFGGRLQEGSTASTLVLEGNDYPDPATESCSVIVMHPALQRVTISISSIVGATLTVSGYDGATPIKRLLQGSIDVAVSVVNATTLKVDSAAGLVTGSADLWDLDVMETRTVSALQNCVATLESPLSAVPTPLDTGYIYQSTTKQAKLVRIKQIRRMPGEQCQISAVDYDPSVYDIPAPDDHDLPPAVVLRPTVLLNGWGNNQHVGDYEGGIDQGHVWGYNNDTTYPYTSPDAAVDGSTSTYASCVMLHTHKYAGCVWSFQALAGRTTTGSTLGVLSSVPQAESGVDNNGRSSSIWYSLDGGSNWNRIYDAISRMQQWDNVAIPDGQDAGSIQVMAFFDSHDDMAHNVYDITLTGTLS